MQLMGVVGKGEDFDHRVQDHHDPENRRVSSAQLGGSAETLASPATRIITNLFNGCDGDILFSPVTPKLHGFDFC